MDDSKKSIKASSVAAFLLMPQFRFCFEQFSFIIPVFMRTVAGMFEGAGLLPPGHPATRYGVEGVRKYGFIELLKEVWHRLRSTAATPFQWSLFVGVVMMVVAIIAAAISVLFGASGIFIGSAAAQIFDLKDDSGATISTAPPTSPSSDWIGGHSDYAIRTLDNLLRKGAAGVGSQMQNAFGGLMQLYNTGILIIAGVIVFWTILTIVVDTARTGQIGGGRHNMVWAPIRIVFALGLMVPLGSSGFSSGQYMVMKLAEWGSNFGSNAWTKYVAQVVNTKMIASVEPTNFTGFVKQYTRMWVCRVVYNGYTSQAIGEGAMMDSLFPQIVARVDSSGLIDSGQKSYSFTSSIGINVCGTVTYPTPNDAALQIANSFGTDLGQALAKYEITMREAYAGLVVGPDPDNESSGGPLALDDGTLEKGLLASDAKKLACAFVAQHIYGPSPGTGPLLADYVCGGDYGSACGAKPVGGTETPGYPSTQCMVDMVKTAFKHIRTAQCGTPFDPNPNDDDPACEGGAKGELDGFILQPEFMAEVKKRGWAAMGTWYHQIAQLNITVAKMQNPMISITEGSADLGTVDVPIVGPVEAPEGVKKTGEVLAKFDTWWQTQSAHPTMNDGSDMTAAYMTGDMGGTGAKGLYKPVLGSSDSDSIRSVLKAGNKEAVGDAIASRVIPDYDPSKIVASNKTLYPLALLSALGDLMVVTATIIYAALIIIPTIVGALGTIPLFGGGAAAIATVISTNPIWAMLGVMAGAILTSGMMLSFWLPILPGIRVAFGLVTWMIAVFEAVVMVPIAALAHLSTEGDGIAGGAKGIWVIWLSVLLRPILMVIGFVGAMIAFNAFVSIFTPLYWDTLINSVSGLKMFFGMVVYTVVYVGTIYMVANSLFKMIDLIPNAVAKYLGGHADTSFDQDVSGMVSATAGVAKGVGDAGAAGASKHGEAIGNAIGAFSKPKPGLGDSGKQSSGTESQAADAASKVPPEALSDRRLKENVEFLGRQNGHNIYAFNYIGQEQRFIGVMADEVLKINPAAVREVDGYLAVDYSKIGIAFRKAD